MLRRTPCGSVVTSRPATTACPPSGFTKVVRIFTAVVLPAPLGPSTPSTEPSGTRRSRPSRAFTPLECSTSPRAITASVTSNTLPPTLDPVRHDFLRAMTGPQPLTASAVPRVPSQVVAQREDPGIPSPTGCRALKGSQAWFYKWRHGDPSPRHARRAQLRVEIARLFAAHRGTYGSPRITADLRAAGWRVSENTVAALMGELGLAARRPKKRRQTTRQGRGRWRAPDLIGRDFGTDRLNHKWYVDGTEIATEEGKLYLDSVLDMGSRRVVGFAVGEHHDAGLPQAALQMAAPVRGAKHALDPRVDAHRSGQRVHREEFPGRVCPRRHQAVDGPGRLGSRQCCYLGLAPPRPVCPPPPRGLHHP